MESIQSEPLNLIKSAQGTLTLNIGKDQKCRDCNSEFCIIRKFQEYRRESAQSLQSPKQPKPKLFECNICAKRFSCQSSLRTHGRLHSASRPLYKCNFCLKTFKWKSNLRVHYAIHADEKIVCELCQKVFPSDKIEMHRNWHRNPQHQCQYCEKAYSNQYKVSYHIKLKHPHAQPAKCEYCTMAFDSVAERRTHISNQHNDQRFKCDICLKTFLTMENLQLHKTKHANNTNTNTNTFTSNNNTTMNSKEYKCAICDQHFTYKRNLYSHLMRHTRNSNTNRAQDTDFPEKQKKPNSQFYDCKICNRIFLEKSAALNCKHGAKHLSDERDVGKTTRENDVQVKISLVSETIEPVIPLFELNIPNALNQIDCCASDIVMQQKPVVLVQAFTRSLDTSTTTTTATATNINTGQCDAESFNKSIDFCTEEQQQQHQRQYSIQPETIVIDDSSDEEIIIDYSLPKVK